MKRIMFLGIVTIGLSIGLTVSAGPDGSKGVLAIAAVSHTDTGTISRSGTESNQRPGASKANLYTSA